VAGAMRNSKKDEEKARIRVSRKVKAIHPVAEAMARNLAEIDPIRFIRILPDLLEASSEATAGRNRIPIVKPGHPSAIGVSVILTYAFQEIQFFAITSAKKGYGGKMVDAVMRALPVEWKAVVLMGWDWSDGFWEHMGGKYANLEIV
jgi:hypothetical protein